MPTQPTDDQPSPGCDRFRRLLLSLLLGLVGLASPLRAETGYDAWLRYDSIDDKSAKDRYAGLPAIVVMLEDSDPIKSAGGRAGARRAAHAGSNAADRKQAAQRGRNSFGHVRGGEESRAVD